MPPVLTIKSWKISLLRWQDILVSIICFKFHAEIVFPGHTLLRVLLSYLSPLLKCWHESSVSLARADRPELIFSAQSNTLKRWQRAYYKAFSWFLPELWADGRRSFPRTNLLSLYGCQALYCIHIAKTPTPGAEIRRICTTSGHHGLRQLYMPNHPNVWPRNEEPQVTPARIHKFLVVFLPKPFKFISPI